VASCSSACNAPVLPPGGVSVASVDSVARAHVVAAECGHSGKRYLPADEHVSMKDLADHSWSQRRLPAVVWALSGLRDRCSRACEPRMRRDLSCPLRHPKRRKPADVFHRLSWLRVPTRVARGGSSQRYRPRLLSRRSAVPRPRRTAPMASA
jgi:hypothetical protein